MDITKVILQGRIDILEDRIHSWNNLLTKEEKEELEPFGQWDYESDVEELADLKQRIKKVGRRA